MKNTKNTQKRRPNNAKPTNKGNKGRKSVKSAQKNHKNSSHQGKRHESNKTPKIKIDLYGAHAVAEAWINPKRHIHTLYITETALEGFDNALKRAHDLGLNRPAPQIIEKSTLNGATPTGSVHQGIGLNCQPLESIDIDDMIRADTPRVESGERSILIMLDQVTDPHNVGAIIRSSCVFGASGIILQKKHAPDLTGVLAKTACGGVEHVPVTYETNLTRSLETLQEAGYFAVALDERGTVPIIQLQDYQKLVLVMGAEGPGIRRLVKEQCDALTSLPTAGPISSLNVSNATAVALYAVSS